jgi:outer membrane protein OmpA-like peptidoglycan-associated protein
MPPAAPQTAAAASAAPAAAAPQRTAALPQRGSEEPPAESQLTSPAVRSVPEGEEPGAPPPPPNIPPSPIATTAASRGAATQTAALSRTASAPAAAQQVAEIGFADGSAVLTGDARGKLNDIAAMQHQGGGALRVVGHSEPVAGKDAVQQRIDGLALALDRAKAVAQALSAAGVPANDIVVEAAPTRASETPRAEIFILR